MMQSAAEVARDIWSGQRPAYHVEGAGPSGPSYGAALRDLVQPWSDLYYAWVDAVRLKPQSKGHHANCGCRRCHPDDCRCPRCHPDDCHCRCCIVDADLLVRTRAGERRLVPIVIENNLRREREVELQLSGWSSSHNNITVTGGIEAPTKFTLKPCEEKVAVMTIDVAAARTANLPARVADCVVFYADLRVLGCDLRSIRIAVAVLPLDCDAFRIDCRCACCC
jgi:hypothetical protein